MQIAGIIATLQRVAPYVAVWLALVLVVAFTPLANLWHAADYAYLQNALHLGRDIAPDRDLTIVDLGLGDGAGPGDLRAREIGFLDAIGAAAGYATRPTAGDTCARAAAHLGARKDGATSATEPPSAIIFDIAFTAETSRLAPQCVTPLVAELRQMRMLGVKVYAAQDLESANGGGSITGRFEIDPNYEANQDASIYAQLSGSGHTLIVSDPNLPGGPLFFYPKILRIPSAPGSGGESGSCALAIVATGRAEDVCLPILARSDEREGDTEIVTVGAGSAFTSRLQRTDRATRDLAALANRTVVIGDQAIDTAAGDPRSKFEILTWAVSQSIADLRGRPVPRVLIDATLMLVLAVFLTIVSLLMFLAMRSVFARKPGRLAIATAVALLVPIAILGVVDGALAARSILFSQITLPIFAIVVTAGISLWAAIASARRDLFVTQLQAHQTSVAEKYDVFISYARTAENTKWVEDNVLAPLSNVRTQSGKPLRIFFDRQSIKIGYTWYTTLVEGVYGSRFFVPIYSEDYFDRPFCRDELDIAMLRQVGADAFILPVSRSSADKIPTRYARVQFIDADVDPHFIDSIIATVTGTTPAAVS